MQVFNIFAFVNFLTFQGILLVNCDVVEFEQFKQPDGPWGRQPILLEEDGGYTNLLVAIHRDVNESSIIEGIKNTLTLTSQMLHDDTDQVLYLKEIIILVPDNWEDSSEYEKSRPNETFQTARIIIRNDESEGSPPSYPFVRQLTGDASEAQYMYLPSSMLTSSNESIQNENAAEILNLWGHLRWGLMKTDPERSEQISSSVSYKTVWKEYMENSLDFQSSKAIQHTTHTTVTPSFRILRHRDTLSLVILDARENMEENAKFERMKEAFENYVWNLFPAYSWVGVVVVSDQSRQLLPVVKLWESPGFRKYAIIRKLPRSTNGTSSIGEGFLMAKKILSRVRRDISGSFIFVMSDGTDDISPTLNEVIPEVTSDGIVVASLPFSTNISENIIMNNTINQNFVVKDTNRLYRLEDHRRCQKVFQTDDVEIPPFQSKLFEFSMDKETNMDSILIRVRVNDTLAKSFTDFLYYTEIDWQPSFVFPFVFSGGDKAMDIRISEKAIQGFKIQANDSLKVSFEVFTISLGFTNEIVYINEEIRTHPFSKSDEVNFTFSGVPLYVSITKNENPVVNVASVIAIITAPDGLKSRLPLQDKGDDEDVQLHDGIYSNYFNNFTTEGEYTVEFQVYSGENSCLLRISPDKLNTTSPSVGESSVCETNYTIPLSPFQRFPSTISFTVSGIPPNTVTDLMATIDESQRMVELSWTAAGEDLSIGRAENYEIRYGKDESDVANNFDSARDLPGCSFSHLVANTSHRKEYFCADFSGVNGHNFVIAIRAIDSHGNKGNVTEGILVTFPIETTSASILSTTPLTESTVTKRPTETETDVSVINKMTDFVETRPFLATSIIGVVACFTVIVGLKRYLKKKKEENTEESVFFIPTLPKNRVTPSPSPSPSPRRSPCTPQAIVLEDI